MDVVLAFVVGMATGGWFIQRMVRDDREDCSELRIKLANTETNLTQALAASAAQRRFLGKTGSYVNKANSTVQVRCVATYHDNGNDYALVKPTFIAGSTPYAVRLESVVWD
jgi:hypothetical protein